MYGKTFVPSKTARFGKISNECIYVDAFVRRLSLLKPINPSTGKMLIGVRLWLSTRGQNVLLLSGPGLYGLFSEQIFRCSNDCLRCDFLLPTLCL